VSEDAATKSVHETTSEVRIVNEAWRLADGGGLNAQLMAFQMEMTRRNNVALRAFNASSDKWSKTLIAATVVLIVFTGVLIYLAWALLQRGD
jgi:hypothetical protein